MKLGPVTKMAKDTKRRQKLDNDAMSKNCNVIVTFLIYSQFAISGNQEAGFPTHSL